LLKNGTPEFDYDDEAWGEPHETEDNQFLEGDDGWNDGDLNYITAILESFSRPKPTAKPRASNYAFFPPEGAHARVEARQTTPPKFNQNFNQESTINNYRERDFSYSSHFEEEGTTELADYFSDEEDDSLDNEDTSSDSDNWRQPDLNEFEDFSNTTSEFDTAIFGLETIYETNFEDSGDTNTLNSISSLSEETKLAFSAWQPFIPPEHTFQNFWPSDFSQQVSLSQEPTLIQISTITGPIAKTKPTPAPKRAIAPRQGMTPSPLKDWHSFRPAMRHYTNIWKKPWPESSGMCNRTRNSHNESPDHPEQSK
jgi:hypothetical protein